MCHMTKVAVLGAMFFNIRVGIVGCVFIFSFKRVIHFSYFTSSHPSSCPPEFEDNILLLACD